MRTNARKFRLALTWLALVGLVLGLGQLPVAQAASPIYVRPGGDDTLCDGTVDVDYSPGVAPNCAVETIQKGIDLVDSPGTVNVANGTYNATSSPFVRITKTLTLIGESRDGVILDGTGTSTIAWAKGIHVTANDVTIRNLTVQNFGAPGYWGYGILFRDYDHDDASEGYIYYTGGVVENVKSQNNCYPMYAFCNQYLTIRNCLIQNNLGDGMFIAKGSSNATITGNTVLNSGDHGIWVGGAGWCGPSCPNATITDNTINGAREGGISFVASDGATIAYNSITNVAGEGWSVGALSLKDGPSNVEVYKNIIYGNSGSWGGYSGTGHGVGIDGTPSNINLHDNWIYGNAGYGCYNYSTVEVEAENNWWGSAYGPQDDTGSTECLAPFEGGWNCGDKNTEPAGQLGDNVSENVDYCPWAQATLWVEPDDGWVEEGQNIIIDVRITANDMNGVEFDLDFDPSLLHVVNVTAGSMWSGHNYNVVQNTYNNTAGTIDFAAFLQEADTDMDVTDGQVARIEFQGDDAGISTLDLNDAIVANPEGESIEPVLLDDGTLTVFGHGSVHGVVQVQGRPGDWDGAQVTVSGGPGGGYTYNTTVTNLDGTWSIANVVEGDYEVEVEMALYLDGLKQDVSITDAGDTDVGQVKVLGGDCNDSDGVLPCGSGPYGINVLDATIVADEFGNTSPTDARADINDDNTVNILDAALLGGNWHKCSPVPW